MEHWFTTEAIDSETTAISEYRHWEQVHSYLLRGQRRALLIDSGLGVGDIGAVVRQLTALPVTVATTHVHWDHIGGHRHFCDFAVHRAEVDWLAKKFPIPLQVVRQNLTRGGQVFPAGFEPGAYQVFRGDPSRVLRHGDCFDLGGRQIQVLHTPGHSPGHLCFYEPARGYLFSGDLIYAGQLDAFYPSTDPEAFAQSVQRMAALPVKKLLPGHYTLDISPALIGRVDAAFSQLRQKGQLRQGSGIFDGDGFSIHL